jgi:hypothetical protein
MRWLALLTTMAACGAQSACPDQLQVCIVTDANLRCTYNSAACCAGTYKCSAGTVQSAPGTCALDDTMVETCT